MAPIARRKPSSCSRRRVNAVTRLATFTTDIRSRSATAPNNVSSGRRTSPVICSSSETIVADHSWLSALSEAARSPRATTRARSVECHARSEPSNNVEESAHLRLSAVGAKGIQSGSSVIHPKRGASKSRGITPTTV